MFPGFEPVNEGKNQQSVSVEKDVNRCKDKSLLTGLWTLPGTFHAGSL